VPVVGTAPFQPPEAVQALALVVLHCSVTEAPIATVLSLAFRLTKGGAATAGVAVPPEVCVVCGVSGVDEVSALELVPHAASELSAANPSIDFNANAIPKWRLRRIELITHLPRFTATNFFRGTRFRSSAIFEITYSFDISNSPTCRHLQTTYVQ
jgi:hypothetical protein